MAPPPMKYPDATTLPGKYRQIWEGRAECMPSGLCKKDLKENKDGRIVSKKRSARSKALYAKNKDLQEMSDVLKMIYTVDKKKSLKKKSSSKKKKSSRRK